MTDAYFSSKCCTHLGRLSHQLLFLMVSSLVIYTYSLVQMGFVGGGGGSGAPWLPIGGAVRVLATHTTLPPTHQSHLLPNTLRPKHKAPRSFEWAAFIWHSLVRGKINNSIMINRWWLGRASRWVVQSGRSIGRTTSNNDNVHSPQTTTTSTDHISRRTTRTSTSRSTTSNNDNVH